MADLVVPQLGESISEAVVAKWLKQVGDAVADGEPVAELETDKITAQLPSPVATKKSGNGESLDKDQLLKLTPSQRVTARETGSLPRPAHGSSGPAASGPSDEDRLAQVDPRDEIVPMSTLRKRVAERLVQA